VEQPAWVQARVKEIKVGWYLAFHCRSFKLAFPCANWNNPITPTEGYATIFIYIFRFKRADIMSKEAPLKPFPERQASVIAAGEGLASADDAAKLGMMAARMDRARGISTHVIKHRLDINRSCGEISQCSKFLVRLVAARGDLELEI
jgi:hypothetical protein